MFERVAFSGINNLFYRRDMANNSNRLIPEIVFRQSKDFFATNKQVKHKGKTEKDRIKKLEKHLKGK